MGRRRCRRGKSARQRQAARAGWGAATIFCCGRENPKTLPVATAVANAGLLLQIDRLILLGSCRLSIGANSRWDHRSCSFRTNKYLVLCSTIGPAHRDLATEGATRVASEGHRKQWPRV